MENFLKICKMDKRQRRVYSESFKKEKVVLIENGELGVTELMRLIGMNNPNSIYKWLKLYGKRPKMETVVVETESDYYRLKDLEKQLKEALQVVGKQQIKLQVYEGIIEQVNLHYGEDPIEKFLKK